MARPIVIVFQELATPEPVIAIPDLNGIIVGPAYDLFDYPEDAGTILLSQTYGQLNQPAGGVTPYVPPIAGADAVTVLDGGYPGQSAGSVIDTASVRMYLRFPRVILGSTNPNPNLAPTLGTAVITTNLDQTLLELVGMSTSFVAAGIRPGDRVILTSSNASPVQTVVRTVASVGEPNTDGLVPTGNEKFLRLTQNLPASGVGADQWVYDNATEIRVERELPIQELLDPNNTIVTFPEPGTGKLVVKGGAQLSVTITPVATVTVPLPTSSAVNRYISYSELYLAYAALRQDLQNINSYTSADLITINGIPNVRGVGKIDARNPQAVGLSIALQNAGTSNIYGFGVSSNDAVGHANARSVMSSRRDLYAFGILSQDIDIIAAYKTEFEAAADPNQALANGVRQKFRMVLGNVPLPEASTIYEGSISAVAQQPTGANTGLRRTIALAATSTDNINVRSVLPGDSVVIGLTPSASAWQNRRGTHLVGHVNTSKDFPNLSDPSAFEVIPGSSRWDDTAVAPPGDIEVLIKAPDGTVKVSSLARVSISTGVGPTLGTILWSMRAPTVVGGPYTVTYAVNAALTSVSLAVIGFSIVVTVNGTSHTHNDIASAVLANTVVSSLVTAAVTAGGAQVVDPVTQSVRNAVPGQTGAVANITVFAANEVTLTGLTGMTPASVGHYIEISGAASAGNNGQFLITAFIGATSVRAFNTGGVAPDANNGAISWTERYAYTEVVPVTGACNAQVTQNDDLYNRLEDASALFLDAGVRVGDTIEIPIDPNNYTPSAFDGRILSYTVGAVLNENRLLIANGLDDTATVARELPHLFARDLQDRFIDNTAPNALAYRIRRKLTKDEQIIAMAQISQSVRQKRCVLVAPDLVQVSDLRDGSLPRSNPTTRTLASFVPGYYQCCQFVGAIAGLPAQHGLTNLGLNGIKALKHSSDYFDDAQLTRLSDSGFSVMIQDNPNALPYCIHQLTTDPTALQTGELSVVKNVDFVALTFLGALEPFIGVYNNTQAAQNDIARTVTDVRDDLVGRNIERIGPPLLSGELTGVQTSEIASDRVEVFFRGEVAVPLNVIAFHLVV